MKEGEIALFKEGSEIDLINSYLKKINTIIQKNKKYPPSARMREEEGKVEIQFTLSQTGNLIEVALTSPSIYPEFNKAAKNLVDKLSPFPAFPEGVDRKSITVKMEVVYELKEKS